MIEMPFSSQLLAPLNLLWQRPLCLLAAGSDSSLQAHVAQSSSTWPTVRHDPHVVLENLPGLFLGLFSGSLPLLFLWRLAFLPHPPSLYERHVSMESWVLPFSSCSKCPFSLVWQTFLLAGPTAVPSFFLIKRTPILFKAWSIQSHRMNLQWSKPFLAVLLPFYVLQVTL